MKLAKVGERYGRLVVISEPRKEGSRMVVDCRCDCGGCKVASDTHLRRGDIKSCGCLKKEWGQKMREANSVRR